MSILCHVVVMPTIFFLQVTVAQPPIFYPDYYRYSPILYRPGYYGYDYHFRAGVPIHTIDTDYDSQSLSSSSEESLEERANHHHPQFRKSDRIKYFILDRKCVTYGVTGITHRKFPGYSMSKSRSKDSKKLTDCWVELNGKNQSANVEKNIWVEGGETKLIVHGYTPKYWNSGDDIIEAQGIFDLGEEYSNDTNVMVIDWTLHGASYSYPDAAYNTRLVGKQVVNFLVSIKQRNNFSDEFWSKLHLVGFSLGSHISGVAGHLLRTEHKAKLNRITGLDPAGPEFDGWLGTWPADLFFSLDKKDAHFVDVIHCNAGTPTGWFTATTIGKYGTWLQRGTVDFFPNGGERQSPFCSFWQDTTGCSHNTCVKFFTDSIRKQDYLACNCHNWEEYVLGICRCKKNEKSGTLMGERVSNSSRGRYFLRISA